MLARILWRALVVCIAVFAAPAQAAITGDSPLYRTIKSVPLGAPDRWDYLTFDPASARVYIAHGDRLTVVNGHTGKIVGTVKGIPGGTHGIVVYRPTGTGYTDDGEAGQVVAFDLKTLKVTHRIKAGDGADGIVLDPASNHVFVIDGDVGKLTVIDPKTNKAIATIDAGGKLEFGVADDAGHLYVNGESKREIVRVNTHTDKVTAHWPIASCASPHGIAINRQGRRLFVTCENKRMVVVNADNGTVVSTLPIGFFSDGAAFDSSRKRAFSPNGGGTITVVGRHGKDEYTVLGNVPTMSGGRTMTIDPNSGRLYVVAAHITVNKSAPPTDYRHRYHIEKGSTRLLFLDPVH